MVYDRQSTYLTWGGRLGSSAGTPETWQVGVHLALSPSLDGPGLPDAVELQTLLEGPLSTFHSHGAISLSAGALLEWARCASLDPEGHYTTDPVLAERTALPGGAGSTSAASPQDSLCISLYSGTQFGRANYGRIYMPWWSQLVSTVDGRVQGMAAAIDPASALVEGINSWAASALSSTARIRIMSKLGTGTTKLAKYVRVGDIKDTQRRRRGQIPEQYQEHLILV